MCTINVFTLGIVAEKAKLRDAAINEKEQLIANLKQQLAKVNMAIEKRAAIKSKYQPEKKQRFGN